MGAWIALTIAGVTTALWLRVLEDRAARLGLLDAPAEQRKQHAGPMPCTGGLAMLLGLLPVLLLTFGFSTGLPVGSEALLGGCLAMAALGIQDDRRDLGALRKLLVQTVVVLVVCAAGLRLESIALPGLPTFELGAWAWPVTVLWLLAVTNAFNLIDGLDGLASGLAAVASASIGFVAYRNGQEALLWVCAGVFATQLAFLRHNWHPARCYLGDGGSLLLGMFLAGAPLLLAKSGNHSAYWWVPAVAMGVPLLDLVLCVVRRSLRGRSPLSADRGHVHHLLLARGHGPARSAALLIACSGAAVASVLWLPTQGAALPLWAAGAFLLLPFAIARSGLRLGMFRILVGR